MSTSLTPTAENPFVLHFGAVLRKIDDDDFYEFCQANQDWRIECTSEGDIIILPPTGGETGRRNFALAGSFGSWVREDGTGKGFSSSTMFALPNGARRSPDLAWVKLSRWNALTAEQRRGFPPLCPDFVIELRSQSDSLSALQDKMREYICNGAQLGWLIDPMAKNVYVYRPQTEVEFLNNPASISGGALLEGFTLDLAEVW
jgi:Uma2 family endonuclease